MGRGVYDILRDMAWLVARPDGTAIMYADKESDKSLKRINELMDELKEALVFWPIPMGGRVSLNQDEE